MSEPPELKFIREMCDVLKEQLVEDEKAKRIAKTMADEGAKKWRELRSWIDRAIDAINNELRQFVLSCGDNESGLAIIIDRELNDWNMTVTFNPASAEISYQGTNSEGVFRARLNGSALEYRLDQTRPSPPQPIREFRIDDSVKIVPPISVDKMGEIVIRCVVMPPN